MHTHMYYIQERYLADAKYDAMVAYTAPTDYLVGEVKIPQVLLDDDVSKISDLNHVN